jgi:hypothetical protein
MIGGEIPMRRVNPLEWSFHTRDLGPELRDALEPLLITARSLVTADRRAWLHELRNEAPALADALEQLLGAADPGDASTAGRASRDRRALRWLRWSRRH